MAYRRQSSVSALSKSDVDAILADLNPEQREAASAVSGPVVILAGAGTGKTRVISHRVAYAVATGAVDQRQVIVVSFTNKAAGEMGQRLRGLGLDRATASTVHAAAKRQLEHFWPQTRGAPLPSLIESKLSLVAPLARSLPGGYRFTHAKDLASEIEWAKNRRLPPERYAAQTAAVGREPPIPLNLMVDLYRNYEGSKRRRGLLDFEDLLEEAVRLYEGDEHAAALVRRRYAWFSVDEYQDTNPLQQALLDCWLGDREDIAVVGDPNQTIYSFTGASASYLLEFRRRYPNALQFNLAQNYRSSAQILDLANRLVRTSAGPQLRASQPDGPPPDISTHPTDADELDAVVGHIGSLRDSGVPLSEIAVLTRSNYQLEPFAAQLRAAGLPFRFRGIPFYRSIDVRAAISALRGIGSDADVEPAALAAWRKLGFDPAASPEDPDAVQRHQGFLTLLAITRRFLEQQADATAHDLVTEFERLAAIEADENASGVTLSTIHGAKGAEWEAVFVPILEDGSLPIHYAFGSDDAIAEERRLLYVAITRAKRHLGLSRAATRESLNGKVEKRRPSRFLADLRDSAPQTARPMSPGSRVRHARHGGGWVRSLTARHAAVRFDSGRQANVGRSSLTVIGTADAQMSGSDEPGGRSRRTPRRPAASGRQTEPSDPERRLLDRLMEWRRERARRDGVPAYVVAHDVHLRAIAAQRPRTLEALLAVDGIGPTKAERYGDEILALVGEPPPRD